MGCPALCSHYPPDHCDWPGAEDWSVSFILVSPENRLGYIYNQEILTKNDLDLDMIDFEITWLK